MATALRLERPALDAAAISAALAQLLNRPADWCADIDVCHCQACRRLRALSFRCGDCGYDGPPLVWPCECKTKQPCPTAKHLTACGHGELVCPVCIGGEACVTYTDRYENPWHLIRDVRAVLERGGLL